MDAAGLESADERGSIILVAVGEGWSDTEHPAAVFAARASRLLARHGERVRLIDAGGGARNSRAAAWGAAMMVTSGPGDLAQHLAAALDDAGRYTYTFVAAPQISECLEHLDTADHALLVVENRSETVLDTVASLRGSPDVPHLQLAAWVTRAGDLRPGAVARSLAELPYAGHVTRSGRKGGPGCGAGRVLHATTRDPHLTPRRVSRVIVRSAQRRAAA